MQEEGLFGYCGQQGGGRVPSPECHISRTLHEISIILGESGSRGNVLIASITCRFICRLEAPDNPSFHMGTLLGVW